MDNLIFISSNTIYKRDLERFGEKLLSKRFNIIIISFSNFKLENYNFIPRLITIASGIVFLQLAALYENKLCNNQKPYVSGEGSYCRLLAKTKVTYPSNYVWNNYRSLRKP